MTVSNDLYPNTRIKTGEIAFVKLTNESVFILNIEESDDKPTIVNVRRYNQIDGEYVVEYFFSDELAGLEESINRTMKDMVKEQTLRQQFMDKQKAIENKLIDFPAPKNQGDLFN